MGEEIFRIITPVSICMLLVVILVSILNKVSDSSSSIVSIVMTYLSIASAQNVRSLVNVEEGQLSGGDSELSALLIEPRLSMQMHLGQDGATSENLALEGIGLPSSGAIKLGLGNVIFYSVLVGRAVMYDFMMVYACYLAIIAGLSITLILLAFYQKALPALPVSVMLGVLCYLLTRFPLEAFVVQCSINLVMF